MLVARTIHSSAAKLLVAALWARRNMRRFVERQVLAALPALERTFVHHVTRSIGLPPQDAAYLLHPVAENARGVVHERSAAIAPYLEQIDALS